MHRAFHGVAVQTAVTAQFLGDGLDFGPVVTDHRVGFTLHSLDQVLAGNLDPITDALAADERGQGVAAGSAA